MLIGSSLCFALYNMALAPSHGSTFLGTLQVLNIGQILPSDAIQACTSHLGESNPTASQHLPLCQLSAASFAYFCQLRVGTFLTAEDSFGTLALPAPSFMLEQQSEKFIREVNHFHNLVAGYACTAFSQATSLARVSSS